MRTSEPQSLTDLFPLKLADWYYARKMRNGNIPFSSEIEGVASVADGIAGPIALNFSYDVACSTGIYLTKEGHPSVIRTLDWGLKMAPSTIALTRKGKGGNWIDITYPGFAGSVTALGPHFTAAINRAPLPQRSSDIQDSTVPNYKPPLRDRTRSFLRTIWSDDISPVHLLRQTFEECTTFDGAIHKIATTKTNGPVIIPIAGKASDEAAIIYKDIDYCAIGTFSEGFDRLNALFKGSVQIRIIQEECLTSTNHWPEGYGLPPAHQRRNMNSEGRKTRLVEALEHARHHDVFDLLHLSSIETEGGNIVPKTVLAAELIPATGILRAVTMEGLELAQRPIELCLPQQHSGLTL